MPDEVSITYNGEAISDKKGSFPFSDDIVQIVAEFGNCEIVCDSDQTLLELETVNHGPTSRSGVVVSDERLTRGLDGTHCWSPV